MNNNHKNHRLVLENIAHRAMIEKGLLPDFSPQIYQELGKINEPAQADNETRDLRNLIWCSIDNNDSLDLDQLTVAELLPDRNVKIYVAVADVDAIVTKKTAIDDHAQHNTTSVYTAAKIFPMLPEKLSTDLTSLNLHSDRRAIVIEMVVADDGTIESSDIYMALVRNHAKLAYSSVAAWLSGTAPMPEAIGLVDGLEKNLRMQDAVAQKLSTLRHIHGALDFETIQTQPIFEEDMLVDFEADIANRAKKIIEDFMVAANGVTARFLASKNLPSLRRVVRTPKYWDKIVVIAGEHGCKLPKLPDSIALNKFLLKAKNADPFTFPELSLSVIKLMGAGQYVVEYPGDKSIGHFGLAVKDYTHSTAPNRRYPDLITQRMLKESLNGKRLPYTNDELEELAKHCTQMEDAVKKIERLVEKSAAAILLEDRIGETFDALVTGASEKGTWVRIINPPVEGKLVSGFKGLEVGGRLIVELVRTDVEQGFIDFKRAH